MSKDVNMEKDTKLVNNYMAFRPPLEQWIEEDREKKWKEAEAAGTISNIVKKKFQPEIYIPTIGLCVGAGILGYRMSKLKHHRQVGELPNYLIYTRLAVQGTVVLSFVAFAAIQTGRFLSKKYGDK